MVTTFTNWADFLAATPVGALRYFTVDANTGTVNQIAAIIASGVVHYYQLKDADRLAPSDPKLLGAIQVDSLEV